MGNSVQLPAGFELEQEESPRLPAGFELESQPQAKAQVDPTELANQALASTGIKVSAPAAPRLDTMHREGTIADGRLTLPADVPVSPEAQARRAQQNKVWQGAQPGVRDVMSAENIANAEIPGAGTAVAGAKETAVGPNRTRGALRMVSGALEAPSMMIGPAALESPFSTGIGLAAGGAASLGTGKVAEKLGATPEQKGLAETAAFFLPSILGAGIGLRGEFAETPEARGVAGEAFGGKVKAGVAETPEGVQVAGKVGPLKGKVTIPGTRPKAAKPTAPGLEPPTIEAPPAVPKEVAEATQAAVDHKATETMAARVANGQPAVEPPPPPAPKYPEVNDKTVTAVGDAIQKVPEEQRGAAVQEAHEHLTNALAEQGKAFVNGKLHVIDTPQKASKVAEQIINDHIAKVDAEAEHAAKEAAKKPVERRKPDEVERQDVFRVKMDQLYGDLREAKTPEARAEIQGAIEREQRMLTEVKNDAKPQPPAGFTVEPKYKHGSTQANIPADSEAHKALESARQRISDADVAGDGKDVGGNHITVRYGLDGDVDKVKTFLEQQAPFEASLGKTQAFPPSENSDGAAVIHAPIEAPELHRINAEIEKHGQFTKSSFPEYKPHATVAYVKPEKASRYVGMDVTHGKKFTVSSIAITDRNGKQTEVKLKGAQRRPIDTVSVPTEAEYEAIKAREAKGSSLEAQREYRRKIKAGQTSTAAKGPQATGDLAQKSGVTSTAEENSADVQAQAEQMRMHLEEIAQHDPELAKAIEEQHPEVKALLAQAREQASNEVSHGPAGNETAVSETADRSAKELRADGSQAGAETSIPGEPAESSVSLPEGFQLEHSPGSPEYDTLKKRVAELQTNRSTKPVAANAIAEKFRVLADGLTKQIEEKQRPNTQNPTPKRNAQEASRRFDARNLERTQRALRALADAHEAGTVPPELAKLRTKDEVHNLVRKYLTGEGGYYSRIESNDYADKSPAGVKLQGMVDSSMSPEALAKRENANKLRTLEQEVSLSNIPGFFPTPKPIVQKMLDRADIQPGMKVLEPSAGKGDIADAIKEAEPDAKIDVVEQNHRLNKILELKGYNVAGSDFMEHSGEYDRVVMNPPFEKGADMEHVSRAFDMLTPGGRMVSIMSPHFEFASDKKSADFRNWLESVGGRVEKLPESSFKASGTGVASRMVVIDKPDEAHSPVSTSVPPGEVGRMPVRDIAISPSRFQFKLSTDAEGVGTLLKEQNHFNPELAGVISVWRDPVDGKFYVVNGHHRLELAKRTGQESVTVLHIDAQDAAEARSIGALQNIAEGRGTPVDAAKFMRDTGIGVDDMKREGISMGEATAAKGAALSRLDPSLFSQVIDGSMPVERAVAIGEATENHAEQKAIAELIERQERKGKRVTNEVVRELVRFVKGSGTSEESTLGLFGAESISKSHALEKAEVSAYVKAQLQKDKRLFGFVAKSDRAEELERGNNIIDVKTSKALAEQATQGEQVYNKLSERAGPISDVLDDAAARIAAGENPNVVKQEAFDNIRSELSQALPGGQEARAKERTAGAAREFSFGGTEPASYLRRTQKQEPDNLEPLTEEQLASWAKSRSLKIEPAGEQGSLFGAAEPMFRVSRIGSDGERESALVPASKLEKMRETNARVAKQIDQSSLFSGLQETTEPNGLLAPVETSRPGPGAQNQPAPSDTQNVPSIQALTDSIARQIPAKKSLKDRLKAGPEIAAPGLKDTVLSALKRLQGGMAALWDAYNRPPQWNDYEDATGKWSGAENANALDLLRFTNALIKAVPEMLQRAAMSIYIEAAGDQAKLQQWADDIAGDPKTKKYAKYFAAATELTDEEKTIANNISNRNDATLEEAQKAGILKAGRENYIFHIWNNRTMLNRVMAEQQFTSLVTKPSFTKQRTLPTYYDGIKKGFEPKSLDAGFLTASHEKSFREAIAARAYIKALKDGKSSDGRPLVATSWASAKEVGNEDRPDDSAYLIKPNLRPGEEYGDYRAIDHPALRGWRWSGEIDGKPVFVQGDMLVHPDIYRKLKNNLSRSALRDYTVEVAGHTFKPGESALRVSSEIKHAILSYSGFHETTLRLHATEHTTQPFGMKPLDLNDQVQKKLVDHGMMVAHYDAMDEFGEGLASGGAVTKIPGIGPQYQRYAHRLFTEVQPELKMSTGLNALERNLKRYKDELSEDQIYALTAQQMNADFGGLNYKLLGRNKTLQDVLRLTLMAPDFLEARGRLAGQAGKPYGREQLRALLIGAVVFYTVARIMNELISGDAHWDKPFALVYNHKEYSLRTVQEDIWRMVSDPRAFVHNRLSPPVSLAEDMLSGRDRFGKKTSMAHQLAEAGKSNVPIPVQPWMRQSHDSTAQKIAETILKMVGINAKREQKPSKGTPEHWFDSLHLGTNQMSLAPENPSPSSGPRPPAGFELDPEHVEPSQRPEIVPPGGADNPQPIDKTPAEPAKKKELSQVGKRDPESGRQIVQPKDDQEEAQRLATAAAPELEAKLSQLAAMVPGAQFERLRPQKSDDRLEEKTEDKPAETISDYVGAQVAADSPEAKDRLLALLKEHFRVLEVEDKFLTGRPDKAGYPSTNVQVQLENGASAEIQIVPKEVQDIVLETHPHYKAWREAELEGDTESRDRHWAVAEKMNQEALGKFKARNGVEEDDGSPVVIAGREFPRNRGGKLPELQKGSLVTVGGQRGEIAYLSPTMNIARVKLGGSTKTVSLRELQRV